MHAGVVGSQVEKHEIGAVMRTPHSPLFRMEAQCLLLGLLLVLRQAERRHFSGARRMVLMQWVASPGGRQQDAAQVRVAGEDDAEHVPDLALVPVGRRPDVGDGGHHASSTGSATLRRMSALRANDSR